MNRVDGKVALVTGAARGIGAQTARLLAEAGAAVVITDVLAELGEAGVGGVEKAGGRALFLHHDVTREAEWERVIQTTVEHFGGLQILVNNAGIYRYGKI